MGHPDFRVGKKIFATLSEKEDRAVLKLSPDEHVALVESAGPRKKRTLGMMTMEDLLEEVVGELEDEFDSLPRQLHDLGGSVLMAGGGADAAEALGRAGAALTGDERGTVAAWILARLGRGQ